MVVLVSCGPPSPPPVVISFADTPAPVLATATVASRPTRLERPTQVRRISPTPVAADAPQVLGASVPPLPVVSPVAGPNPRPAAPASVTSPSLPGSVVTANEASPVGDGSTTTQRANPSRAEATPTSAVEASPIADVALASVPTPPPNVIPSAPTPAMASSLAETALALPTTPAPTLTSVPDSPTPSPTIGSTAVATTSPKASGTPFPGQVSEDQGVVVTSLSRSSKYYYMRSDTGWKRIRSENRVWFMNVADLLRAFPRRTLHQAKSSGAGTRRRRTATPTP